MKMEFNSIDGIKEFFDDFVFDEKGKMIGVKSGSDIIPIKDGYSVSVKHYSDGRINIKYFGEKSSNKNNSRHTNIKKFSQNSSLKSGTSLFGSVRFLRAKNKLIDKIFEDIRHKYFEDIFEEYLRKKGTGQDFSFFFIFSVNEKCVTYRKFTKTDQGRFGEPHIYYFSEHKLPEIYDENDRLRFESDLVDSISSKFNLALKSPYNPLLPELNILKSPAKSSNDKFSVITFVFC